MTCSCCASRLLARGRRELRLHVPTHRSFYYLVKPARGPVLRALCTGCRLCTNVFVKSRCQSAVPFFSSGTISSAPSQRRTTRTPAKPASIRPLQLQKASKAMWTCYIYLRIHAKGMHGNVQLRSQWSCATTSLTARADLDPKIEAAVEKIMSFIGISVSMVSLTLP